MEMLLLLPLLWAALTQTPDIQVKEPLESGRPSYLTCSVPGACDGATPFTISWMGAALGAPGLNLEASNSSEILLTPHPQDHGTNLTCRVTFPRAGVSTQRRTQGLSVSVPIPPHSPAGKPELEGGFVLGAIAGAGVALLLSLCPCLIFFINRTHRVAVGAVKVAMNMTGPTRGQGQRAPWRSSHPFPGQPAWCKGPL
uniref:Ig-like domain-containing protein n=1 Tax=Neovison vison TaxID=452646 RepID=A0A8C7BBT4_NEOVI